MDINKSANLVMRELYEYDVKACVYTLLQNIRWDLSDIPYEDKEQRNIKIGLLQKQNPRIARYLLENTNGIVQYYIDKNSVKDEEIVVRQRDGLILTRPLEDTTSSMPLEYRSFISMMIITMDRKWFMLIKSNGDVSVKGVPNKPVDTGFYNMFRNLGFGNKKTLASGMEKMRRSLFNSSKSRWFAFEKDNEFQIPIKGMGIVKVSKSGVLHLDPEEIDKHIIWDKYIWPFCQPLLLYCE